MATLTFFGAVTGVTGSAYLLETAHARVLLDCGLYQGRRKDEAANFEPFPFDPRSLDGVVLSHAHLDHSGRIPQLIKEGYAGPLHMTSATVDLLEVMLKDSAHLIERDVEWENKIRRREHKKPRSVLYTLKDVEKALDSCMGVGYRELVQVAEGITICFRDAGHILGSSIVEVFIDEDGKQSKLVFSGDLGNFETPLLKDPEIIDDADVLLLESTYGNRDHRSMEESLDEFESILHKASKKGGNILIPSFAVGRTQDIIFILGELYQQGRLDHQAVYLDSPMAIDITAVYDKYMHMFNEEDQAEINGNGGSTLKSFLPILRYSTTTEESMNLNKIDSGAIIIAGSGMCNGGRIRHHLKHNLWKHNAHVIIVGYQALGTTGRALVDGKKIFRLGRDKVVVKAKIHTIGGFSAHAGQTQLLEWARQFKDPKPSLYLVHGEQEAKDNLCQILKEEGWDVAIPDAGQQITF